MSWERVLTGCLAVLAGLAVASVVVIAVFLIYLALS